MPDKTRPAVLLVDDSPANLLALSAILESLDVELVEARSGAEAVAHVEREAFAVALVDVQMPIMDGFQTATRLRALPHGAALPILFLTAIYADDDHARRGYEAGGADYIVKPFNSAALRARVASYVSLFRQREEVSRVRLELRTRERDEAERRLVAFERIATAALETDDVGTFLHSLLGVFLGAADSAETVSILHRQGDTLTVRASIGLVDGGGIGYTIPVGFGFAGRVAGSGAAELVRGDALASMVRGPLQVQGLRVLYGVPLVSEGQVIGVAHIGSTRTDSFTEAEMRLFRAVVERASWVMARGHARKRLYDVFDVAPVGIAVFRPPAYSCEFANHAFLECCGGRDLVDLGGRPSGPADRMVARFERVIRDGESIVIDELRSVPEGAPEGGGPKDARTLRLSLHPLRDALGRPEEVLMVAIDLTQQVRVRQALQKSERERERLLELERAARKEAETASRMKDAFLATVSHELRTPLSAILGWTSNARRGVTQDLDRVLATIERSAQSLAHLVDDVLDLSRVVSGKLRLNLAPVELARVLGGAMDAVRPAAEAKGVELENLTSSDLGRLAADGDRLQQVVWNLLSNAVKFTPAGGRVQLSAVRDEERVTLRVQDSGQGIDPSFLQHVFDPFRQADASPSRSHGGLGLGLAIAKQLVVAHGGTIRVESEGLGKGATFTTELPLRAGDGAEPRRLSPPHPHPAVADAPRARLDGLRVLVVDDQEDFREFLGECVRHHGARVTTAASAKQALGEVASFRPHVIVSDLGMPGEDGFWLLRELRARKADEGGATPAIALTAYARAEDRQRALASGFGEFVPKPVDLEQLLERLARHRSGLELPG